MNKYLSFLFYLPPFFFAGAFFPLTRYYWLAVPVGALFALPFLFLLEYLLNRPNLSCIPRAFAAAMAVLLGGASLYGFARFSRTCVLTETPAFLLPLVLFAFSLWLSLKSTWSSEKLTKMAGPVLAFLFVVSIVSTAFKIRGDYLPLLEEIVPLSQTALKQEFLPAALLSFFLYLVQSFILFALFSGAKKTSPVLKDTMKGLFLGTGLLSVALLLTVLVLGPHVFEMLSFPLYFPPGFANQAEYLERIEILYLTLFLFSTFVQISLFLQSVKKAI